MPLYVNLKSSSGAVTGAFGTKSISCTFRQIGPAPPAGKYLIYPPQRDPVYGLFALMTAAGVSVAGVAAMHSTVQISSYNVTGPPQETIYVLSEKPITGRNCLVFIRGFADLMGALQSAGGAQIQIE